MVILKKSVQKSNSWNDWPDCLTENGELSLYIVYGSYISSSLDIAKLSKLLTYWAIKVKGLTFEKINISSILDQQAGPYKNQNLVVIGSNEVNKVAADILNLYGDSLPVRLQSRTIVSDITHSRYQDPNNSIIGILPNPWNSKRVVVLCSGINYESSNTSLRVLMDDIKAVINGKPRVLSNHTYAELPLRVLIRKNVSTQENLDKLKSYSFVE